ncbi:hypothetical protein PAECIP111891_00820 [Paenibacillus allorhizoplanae]|jgi:hypothetical protein|uniref:Uncharacterized protein n=2 Tax=Paenibacillus allorhizoplanae TaxID=2905648 RepID=A0ABM9BXW4_9BACL|nr:hypothetical protein [Paenibacillus sp. Soil750]KRE59594.1 hypothetical protein ASL11_25530 [Paenibacillus sp. Soil750]CAH1196225.1 hypothetical protein PAECIP111891_00820 [Paenibacillus allorhizoplanae]
MIYGTKLLDTDSELFAAALSKTPVFVWSLDQLGVYYQVTTGIIVKYTPDHVQVYNENNTTISTWYSRETSEFSIAF